MSWLAWLKDISTINSPDLVQAVHLQPNAETDEKEPDLMLSAGSVGWFARCDEEFIANGLQGVCWLGESARRDDPLQSLVMQMHTRYAGERSGSMQQQTCVALELCFENMRKV